ncbi:hypothetical protein ACXR2U_01890 [Jatrophihabitans sp. YIM 134969]
MNPSRLRGAIVPVIAALSACAAMARRQPLSWDESVTVAVSTRPVHAIIATTHHTDAVLGLYYVFVHGWAWFLVSIGVRPTETWWRLPSAVAAVVTCVVVASIARRHAGVVAGVWAGGLLAVLPLFAFYAADARPYTLAALAVVSAWAVWTRPSPDRSLRSAAVVVLLLATAAWLQLFTVLVWPAFLMAGGRRSRGRAVSVLVLAACAVAPLVAIAARQGSEIGWIPPASALQVTSVALRVGGGVAVVVPLLAVAVAALRVRPLRLSGTRLALGWWCCGPLVVLTAVDLVRPVLVARYALLTLPMVAVVVGVVVARGAPRLAGVPVRVLGAAVLVAAVVTSTVQGMHPWKYEDYRGAAAFALHEVPTGTSVVFAPSSARLGFDLYARRGALRDVALPGGVGTDPLAIDQQTPSLVREKLARTCRVVVVGDAVRVDPAHTRNAEGTEPSVVDDWDIAAERPFGAVSVTVMTNPVCAPPLTTTG